MENDCIESESAQELYHQRSRFFISSTYHEDNLFPAGSGRTDRILADVNFQQAGPSPSDEHRTRVHSAGGEIEHGFHVPVLRAWIDTDSVPGLPAVTDRVQDPDRFEVVVMVHYLRPVEPGDTVRIRELGGAIRHVFTESPAAVSTLLPDSAIPILRARAEVERVDPVATFCRGEDPPRRAATCNESTGFRST